MYLPEETGIRQRESVCSATSDRLRVLVAEDSRLVAEALMFSLDTDPKLEAIGYALNGWDALEYIETLKPDEKTDQIHIRFHEAWDSPSDDTPTQFSLW